MSYEHVSDSEWVLGDSYNINSQLDATIIILLPYFSIDNVRVIYTKKV